MLFFIFFILACMILCAGLLVYFVDCNGWEDRVGISVIGVFVGLVLGIALVFPVAGFTGGAGKDYGFGTAIGTVVESRNVGVIYKTFETKIQQGHGEHSRLLNVSGLDFNFIPSSLIGKRVRIEFDLYFLPDYKRGEFERYVRKVDVLD